MASMRDSTVHEIDIPLTQNRAFALFTEPFAA